ncbi:MAG: threonine--tRNA ligase [Conexivisphaerales archaeon]
MKVLQLHADHISFRPVAKEIASAEECEPREYSYDELAVLFTAIEESDDEAVVQQAASELKKSLTNIKAEKVLIYPYAHLSQNLAEPEKALMLITALQYALSDQGFKVERAPFGWNKSFEIRVKGHPMAEQAKSFPEMKEQVDRSLNMSRTRKVVAVRQLSEEEMLARAKKSDFSGLPDNDHRVLGERLDLFSFYELSPSMPFWHDKGVTLKNILIETVRKEIKKRGYIEISTAPLANVIQWKISGHWDYYRDNMFLTKLGDEDYSLKPMNCPSTLLWYRSKRWSYRDLPLRVACFDPLFRKELSGVATGLLRVKSLQQDDAHIICTEDQVEQELFGVIDLMHWLYGIFNLSYVAKVSTMPEEHIGSEEQWEKATASLIKALRSKGIEPTIKEKEGAFYGPKIDVDVKDSLGRYWQCATIQLDYQLPARFKATYTGADGAEHTPVMIHRAIYGSLERFIGVMLEHYSGRLPVWLSPIQARVIPVSLNEEGIAYCRQVYQKLNESGVRVDYDFDTTTLNFKIRKAQMEKIPYMLILGSKEIASGNISIRTREGEQRQNVSLTEFVEEIREKNANYR